MITNREFNRYLAFFFLFFLYQLVIVVGNSIGTVLKIIMLIVYAVCLVFFGVKFSFVPKEWIFATAWMSKKIFLLTPYLVFPLYNLLVCEAFSLSFFDIITVLFTCITEEFLFRGILFNCLNEKVRCAGFIQGMLFAVCHLTNTSAYWGTGLVIYLFVVLAVGIGFYHITVKYNSLIPAIFLHFVTNLAACDSKCFNGGYETVGLLLCALIYLCFNPIIKGGKNEILY